MPFKRFVETGRVVYIVNGPYKGKLCSIVDIIDQTRILVDGPLSGVPRHGIRINQISLTKFTVKIPRNGATSLVSRAWKEADLAHNWSKTRWAKNLSNKKKRLALTDYDRFRLKRIITRRNRIRTHRYIELKKNACRRFALHGMKKDPKAKFKKNWEKVERRRNKKYAKLKATVLKKTTALRTRWKELRDKKLAKRGIVKKEVAKDDKKPVSKQDKKKEKVSKSDPKKETPKGTKPTAVKPAPVK